MEEPGPAKAPANSPLDSPRHVSAAPGPRFSRLAAAARSRHGGAARPEEPPLGPTARHRTGPAKEPNQNQPPPRCHPPWGQRGHGGPRELPLTGAPAVAASGHRAVPPTAPSWLQGCHSHEALVTLRISRILETHLFNLSLQHNGCIYSRNVLVKWPFCQ